jgi:hypothetical protein
MNRSKAVSVVLAIAACLAGQAAAAPLRMQVGAHVMARVHLNVRAAPAELVISAEDARRGFVELARAVQFDIRTNCRYRIEIHVLPGQVASAHATLLDRSMEVKEGSSASLDLPADTRGSAGIVAYRFILSPGAKAGTYAWPTRMSVQSIAA